MLAILQAVCTYVKLCYRNVIICVILFVLCLDFIPFTISNITLGKMEVNLK